MRRAALLCLLAAACTDKPNLVARGPAVASTVIHDVAVLDVVTGTVTPGRDVRIEGGRIVSIGPAAKDVEAAEVVDGKGATLLPGLIDFHGHTGSNPEPPWDAGLPNAALNLQRYLFCGITHVFDPGGFDEEVFERRADLAAGEVLGPHLFTAGPVFTAPAGHPVPMFEQNLPSLIGWYIIDHSTRQVGTADAATTAVRELLPSQPDLVKLVIDRIPESAPRLDPQVAKAIVEAAKQGGVRTVAHIGTTQDAIDAADAGIAAWIHGVYKERIEDDQIEKIAGYGIPMAPTLVVFDSYATLGREPRVPNKLERAMVPAEKLASYDKRPEDFDVNPELLQMIEVMAEQRKAGLDNVRRLHAAGVTILAGSDAQAGVFHGAGLHRELRLLEKAGLSRAEVLRAATIYTARFLSKQDDPPFGVVAEGKAADLLLVNGDPTEDLGALEDIRAVFLSGQRIERKLSSR